MGPTLRKRRAGVPRADFWGVEVKRLFYVTLVLWWCVVAGATAGQLDTMGRVVAVIDGDTLDVLTDRKELVRVRLAGIDAPEKRQPFGQAAKRALSALAFHRPVRVEANKNDRYGRVIGKIVVSNIDVNLRMVAAGYAWHYRKYMREQSGDDRRAYGEAEDDARRRRIGLWQDQNPIPPWEFRAERRRAPLGHAY
jgi:endonuclease YncB( thermonuclease family)